MSSASFVSKNKKPDSATSKAILKQILQEKSYLREGPYILSSGEKSDVFFDVKMTSLHPQGATISADLILDMLEAEEVHAVGGLAIGACPIVAAVCVRSFERGRPIPAFYVRKDKKDHGTMKQIEGYNLKAGDNVVILDDVATKGGAMLDAIGPVAQLGCKIVRTIVIVDREQGAVKNLAEKGYRLESIFKRSELE